MPWVKFIANYNFVVTPAVTIAYKAGMVEFVHRRCATLAVAAGRAERTERPEGRFAAKGKRSTAKSGKDVA